MRSYLEGRPPIPGPLFCHFDGSPLTRYQFVVILKKTLLRVGDTYKCYSSHSFRIGCATNLSIEGVSDSVIMQLGNQIHTKRTFENKYLYFSGNLMFYFTFDVNS